MEAELERHQHGELEGEQLFSVDAERVLDFLH